MRARSPFSTPGLRTRLARLGAAVALGSQISLVAAGTLVAPPQAQAITEAVAAKKLAVIPVFVLTDEKGTPCPFHGTRT